MPPSANHGTNGRGLSLTRTTPVAALSASVAIRVCHTASHVCHVADADIIEHECKSCLLEIGCGCRNACPGRLFVHKHEHSKCACHVKSACQCRWLKETSRSGRSDSQCLHRMSQEARKGEKEYLGSVSQPADHPSRPSFPSLILYTSRSHARMSTVLLTSASLDQCDGQKPCGRCRAQKDVECVYEVPVRQSKENLRTEIEQLRRHQRSSESVLKALARNEQWEDILRRLRSGQSIEVISEWLSGQGPTAASVLPTIGRPAGIGANLTPLAAFAGASTNSYTPYAAGVSGLATGAGSGSRPGPANNTISPVSTTHPQNARQDVEPGSPWGTHSHFSAASHGGAGSNRSNSHPDAMNWGAGPPQTRVGRWVEDNLSQAHGGDVQRYRGLDQVLAPELPQLNVPATTWTDITSDTAFVQHLLALYFCWEYPTFASLSKEHFLKDYQAGRPRYCSRMLINALLALGCRFSSQPSTLANPNDPYSSGDHFFKECQRLFYEETNHHNLTTIQALGIMSIREASCGRDSESWYFAGQSIRLAIEMGLHRVSDNSGDSDEVAVQAATFWGAFSLDQ